MRDAGAGALRHAKDPQVQARVEELRDEDRSSFGRSL